jgi:hypothetical protein
MLPVLNRPAYDNLHRLLDQQSLATEQSDRRVGALFDRAHKLSVDDELLTIETGEHDQDESSIAGDDTDASISSNNLYELLE